MVLRVWVLKVWLIRNQEMKTETKGKKETEWDLKGYFEGNYLPTEMEREQGQKRLEEVY